MHGALSKLPACEGEAALVVRDFGRGLPADDPSEPFERFSRADPGRRWQPRRRLAPDST